MPARGRPPFRLLHRYGGLASALLVIVVCATGILLNHADALGLGKRAIGADWLLDWYGIQLPAPRSYADGAVTATQLDNQLYAGTLPLPQTTRPLRGIVQTAAGRVVATNSQLLLLTPDGRYIETLDALHGVPAGIRRIGATADGRVVVDTGSRQWLADPTLSDWQPAAATVPRWSTEHSAAASDMAVIARHYRGSGLTFERVLLDLHSGRIFGRAGPWLADATAGVFMLLAMTGIWMWWRMRRRKT